MPDPNVDVKPAAPVAPASPAPALSAQPAPAAATPAGVPSKPDVKPDKQESLVPLPALQEERSKRQALEAEVAELKRMMVAPNPTPPVQQQYDPIAEIEKLWENDPKQAVRAEITMAMDYRDRVDAALEVQADTLSAKYPDFNNYRSVALGHIRTLPLNQRANQGILEAAYWMVRGQKFDTVLQQRENEWLEKYRRGEITAQGLQTPPGSFSAPMAAPGLQMTDEQTRVAEAMGLTPEQYASQIRIAK